MAVALAGDACAYILRHMHRTTILLPPELHRSAEMEARRSGISLSELIRRRLAPVEESVQGERAAFFTRKPWVDAGPSDLAADHDQYLYGK